MGKKILFVGQDQGSGNALAPVIKKITNNSNFIIKVFASEYSKEIFRDLDIAFTDLEGNTYKNIVDFKPDLIVTGASMRNSIEKDAIRYARQHRIRSITILDFWGNYWHRFTRKGKKDLDSLPDLILVLDNYAKEQMISEGFPGSKLAITGNPYFDSFNFNKKQKHHNDCATILFISQPVYKNGKYQTNTKKIQDVINSVSEMEQLVDLIIKPHPKESPDYYENIGKADKIRIYRGKNIKQLLKKSDIILGKDSTVLFESVFSGKPVISYQPEPGKKDNLITNKLGLSYLVRSKGELKIIIRKIINGELKAKTIPTIKYYNDGNNSSRVIKKITQHLHEI